MKRFALAAVALSLTIGCGGVEGLEEREREGFANSSRCGMLGVHQRLEKGFALYSCDRRFKLSMQRDGNLVLYRTQDNKILFSSQSVHRGAYAIMQDDGNLVVYSHFTDGDAPWNSKSAGEKGDYHLKVEDTGNLSIYMGGIYRTWELFDKDPAVPVPACGTLVGKITSLLSCDNRFKLIMQDDGNLVVYQKTDTGYNAPVWDAKTRHKGRSAYMQTDGNLVIYSTETPVRGAHIWVKYASSGAFLKLENTGELKVIDVDGDVKWVSEKTGKVEIPECGTVASGEITTLYSCNKVYRLTMQTDGNLILYDKTNQWRWQSRTLHRGATAAMEGGRLVVLNHWGMQEYQSKAVGAYLNVTNDGQLIIFDAYGKRVTNGLLNPPRPKPEDPPVEK